jgi:1,4-alpha-glucan branching enzyme
MTPIPRENYRIGVPEMSKWDVVLNSDAKDYWGSGFPITDSLKSSDISSNGKPYSVQANMPPLATLIYVLDIKQISKTKKS